MLVKRSMLLSGHATSLALEPAFWRVLEQMAAKRGMSLPALLVSIDKERGESPLASACRVQALSWLEQPDDTI